MQECAISGGEVPRSPQLRVLVTRMADDATIIMTALGAIMTLAVGLVGFGVWQRCRKSLLLKTHHLRRPQTRSR